MVLIEFSGCVKFLKMNILNRGGGTISGKAQYKDMKKKK